MKKHKKTAAFAMALLILLGTAASPITMSYAEGEDSEISVTADSETDDSITSGDFKYTVDTDGNAHVVGCTSEEAEITVPSELDGIKVTEIEAKAFLEKKFVKITIPSTVNYISADNPFASCLDLKEIVVEEGNEDYISVDGILYSKDMKTLFCYPASKPGDSFAVPDGVETLGIAAISYTQLTAVTLPDSLTTMNRHCFSFNEKLASLDMSNTSVDTINVMSFAMCPSLTDVKFSESTTYIDIAAFINCTALADITLPSALTYIGQSAFQGTSIMRVKIPDTVTSIGYCAFGYDEDENPISDFTIIGSSNSAAEKYATDSDEEYDYVNEFNFMTSEIAEKQEAYEAMDVKISGDYEYAVIDGEACITYCTSIDETVTVPAELEGYPVTSVYLGAFLSCDSPNIILPETVNTIGENVFSEYVESITIPGGCTEIEGEEPFLKCSSLREINVTEGDGAYSSADGVLYDHDKTTLLAYPAMKEAKQFTVPKGVKEIASSGFCYNQNIEEVDLSEVETIGEYAFEGCAALKNANLPKTLKTVGKNAFLGCTSMTGIRVYADVEYIGDYAFGYDYDAELAASIQENMDSYAMMGESAVMPYSVMDGFKIYADEDSLEYQYAQACGIEIVTGTAAIGGKNVDQTFIYVICGILAAAVLAVAGILTGKGLKKRKKAKEAQKRKEKAAERKAAAQKEEKTGEN